MTRPKDVLTPAGNVKAQVTLYYGIKDYSTN
jgi:hypothetical protein